MSNGRIYRLKVDPLPLSVCRPGAVYEYMAYGDPLSRPAFGPEQVARDNIKRHAIPVKYYVAKGEDAFIAMDKEVFELIDFVFNEERENLTRVAANYNRKHEDLDLKVKADKRAFNALPWYKRVWLAFKKNV